MSEQAYDLTRRKALKTLGIGTAGVGMIAGKAAASCEYSYEVTDWGRSDSDYEPTHFFSSHLEHCGWWDGSYYNHRFRVTTIHLARDENDSSDRHESIVELDQYVFNGDAVDIIRAGAAPNPFDGDGWGSIGQLALDEAHDALPSYSNPKGTSYFQDAFEFGHDGSGDHILWTVGDRNNRQSDVATQVEMTVKTSSYSPTIDIINHMDNSAGSNTFGEWNVSMSGNSVGSASYDVRRQGE